MVDSDSAEQDSIESHSCWKWKLRCFNAVAPSPNSTSSKNKRRYNSPDENTSAESLANPTTETDSAELQKETCDKIRYKTSGSDFTQDPASSSQSLHYPNSSQDSPRQTVNNNNGLLHFLGLHFNKSDTRHLERTVSSTQQSNQELISKGKNCTTEETRYTKLPLSSGTSRSSVPVKPKASTQASSLFSIQGWKGEKSQKYFKGKSKSDNNLNRVDTHHLQFSSLSSSTPRVENDYFEETRLNSVQIGDHASISLPWKQNNLSSVTSSKSHPNTHRNIDCGAFEQGFEEETHFHLPDRLRSKSLERNSNLRVPQSFNILTDFQKRHDRSETRADFIECHPHRRVRKTLNSREQEILLRHIIPAKVPPVSSSDSRISASDTEIQLHIQSQRKTEEVRKKPSESDAREILCSSAQNSPRSSVSFSPGALSCPPSPPPRPPSTLKALKNRFASPTCEKTKTQTPLSTPRKNRPDSAFSLPPVMNSRTEESPRPVRHHQHNTTSGISMGSVEEARNSGFIHKPMKGWLHSDKLLTKEGVTYAVRYIGCHDVNTSMKSLDFDTRSLIAKECINQVCEAAGFKSIDRKRKIDRRLARILGTRPRLEHAGTDVCLTITSTCLKLTSLENGSVIAVHEMPNISFASGGDATMLDFVAYVAKDALVGRACFVLECGSGLAQDVITTIGQAFELRFKEYLQKRPPPAPYPKLSTNAPEYYNDLPGKVPPETQSNAKDITTAENVSHNGQRTKPIPTLNLSSTEKDMTVNLIDFEAPTPPAFSSAPEKNLESLLLDRESLNAERNDANTFEDPFDMHPLDGAMGVSAGRRLTIEEQQRELEKEPWFHGVISRAEAEALVVNDGDFLVRESQTSPHQYVLTALQNGSPKHLLLVDPEGVVRTKDQTFASVGHLIRHHSESNRPIISAESMVLLRVAVLRR